MPSSARQRLFEAGPSSLSTQELLAQLVDARTAEALGELSPRLLGRAGAGDLLALGVGEAQGARVVAALELGRRSLAVDPPRPARSAPELARLLFARLAPLAHEEFWTVTLSARLHVVHAVRVAAGGLTQCSVLPREALAPALWHRTPALACVHNHPSGDPAPSRDDLRLQRLIDDAAAALGLNVVDHLVLAAEGCHSAREGRFPAPAFTE